MDEKYDKKEKKTMKIRLKPMRNGWNSYEKHMIFKMKSKRLGDAIFSILIFPFSFAS